MAATQLDEWNESAWFRQWLDLARKINNAEGDGMGQGDSSPEESNNLEDEECRTFRPPSDAFSAQERTLLWLPPAGGASRKAWGADTSLIRGSISPQAVHVSGETIFARPKQ